MGGETLVYIGAVAGALSFVIGAVVLPLVAYIARLKDRELEELRKGHDEQEREIRGVVNEQQQQALTMAGLKAQIDATARIHDDLEKLSSTTVTRAEWKQWADAVGRELRDLKTAVESSRYTRRSGASGHLPAVRSTPPKGTET